MNSVLPCVVSSVAPKSASPTSAITTVSSPSCSSSRFMSRVIVIGRSGCSVKGFLRRSVGAGGGGVLGSRVAGGERVDEILQSHVVVMMVADAELFARGVDAVGEIQFGRVDAEVDIGHERAEHQHAIAGFDVFGDFVAAERAFVEAHVERMSFGDDAFAEHRGGHRNAGRFGQPHGFVLQVEAVNLDAEQEHGLRGDFDAANGFFDGLGQGSGVAHRLGVLIGRRNRGRTWTMSRGISM